ncbi:MAG: ABC transporter permease [Firmicutes bacterium]|nr:ABC transporter permease [Bacillota bacterium]
MRQYLVRRLFGLVGVLLGITLLTFIISHMIPADPAAAAAGQNASQETIEQIRKEMGLDLPLYQQYLRYLSGLALHGDLGRSILNQRPVSKDIAIYLPASIELALVSLLISVPLSVFLGVIAGSRAGGVSDALTRLGSVAGASMPIFWLALLMQLLFYKTLRWLPYGGRLGDGVNLPPHITGLYIIDSLISGQWQTLGSALLHLILPALTLGLATGVAILRMTRSALLEVLHEDFIKTARAKGLAEKAVIYKHALRNALVPVVTIIGLQLGQLIAYVFLAEVIFSWPGIGSYAVRAIVAMDFNAIMGVTLVFSVVYVVINLIVDLSYPLIDRRIRY